MRPNYLLSILALTLSLGITSGHAADIIRITEFMASNNGPLADEDGTFSDWIEVHNGGTNVVNLNGWGLTDRFPTVNPWRFPSTNIGPNQYLIVFASGNNRRVPGLPLHTDFRLSDGGEYLALLEPDGTNVASSFGASYPQQVAGISYGIPVQQTASILIPSGAFARVWVPEEDSFGSSWTMAGFDDSSWMSLPTGIGYETDGTSPFVSTTIANSATEFSGVQGQGSWFYGYWNEAGDSDGSYGDGDFTPFPNAGGPFGPGNFWTGSAWDWFNGDPPYTQLTANGGQPSGDDDIGPQPKQWAVRRYVSEFEGPIKISGRLTHTSDWVRVTATNVAGSGVLYVYLTGLGEGYLDDMRLVAGVVPDAGVNLITNGDFENQTLQPNWTVSPNLAGSAVTTAVRHGGNRSLRIISSGVGSTQGSSIWQSVGGVTAGQVYTLSYWYLPSTNSAPLVVRFSGSWIDTTPAYCGDGVVGRILVDGSEVFQRAALVTSSDYSLTVPVHLGSRVDFAIDPGPGGDALCDGASFTAVVQTSDPTVSIVADSVADWSFSGTQGEKNWHYGYFNGGTNAASPVYNAANFIPFPRDSGPHSTNNFWDGASWDWWNGDPPSDEIGQRVMNPNGINAGAQHWMVRRWVSEVSGTITVDWTLIKLEASGAGVTARIYHNSTLRDALTLPGTNSTVIQRSVTINGVQTGDSIDVVLDPAGVGGAFGDGGDRSFLSAVIRGRPGLEDQIVSNFEGNMRDLSASAYLRIPFQVEDPSAIQFLTLRMKYDDGFAAYLNGQLVASANTPALPAWDSVAIRPRPDGEANDFEEFNLTPLRGLLQPGANVLAIHGLNVGVSDGDFLVLPELLAYSIALDASVARYFSPPTPGAVNGFGSLNLGPVVIGASHLPNVPRDDEALTVTAEVRPTLNPVGLVQLTYRVNYSNEVNVPMFDDGQHGDGGAGDGTFGASIPATAAQPGQMVRYYVFAQDTTGLSIRFPAFTDPQNSPQYQGTVVIDPSLTNTLPVMHVFVQNPVLATNYSGTRCSLFYDDEFYDNVGVNLHGQTTAAVFNKRSMDFDMNTGYRFRWSRTAERVNDFNLLTTAPDKAHVRQVLAYETFNSAGVPTHFAFPVRMQQNGALYGVMHFVEKGDDNFLERAGLDREGALYKVYLPLTNAYAGVAEKKTRQNEDNSDLQALIDGCSLRGTALRQFLYDNVDIPEVVNFLATIQLVQNEDCCWFKNYYLYRDSEKTGEWKMLPWDLDLTFGRTFTAWVVQGTNISGGYYDTNIYWTNRYYTQARASYDYIGNSQPLADALWRTPEIFEMYLRRWTSVQEEFLQVSNTHPLRFQLERRVDELAAQIAPDAVLDLARWGTFPPVQSLPTAVEILKKEYLAKRRHWVFNTLRYANGGPYLGSQPSNAVIHFGAIEFNPASGNQAQEFVQLTNPNNYAVDISGWRVDGAIDYTFRSGVVLPAGGSLYLSPDVNAFRARTTGPRGGQGLFVQGNYQRQLSAHGERLELTDRGGRVVRETNYVGNPSLAQRYLRITEIMYHPSPAGTTFGPEELEYVELRNIGSVVLNLAGVRLADGIEFNFTGSAVTSLGAGQSVLVVKNPLAFAARYGTGFGIAGQYVGSLDNGGENVRLEDASGEKILEFEYNNSWYPITDGDGFSLVIVNDAAPWDTWGLPTSWRPAGREGGSPNQQDPAPVVVAPIRINELLTHTDLPVVDTIELFNPTGNPVNLRGWFLSDDFGTPKKYRISTDAMIAAGGYLIFDEDDFNQFPGLPTSFAFSSLGDEAYLFSGDANTNLTGYFHGFRFGAAQNEVSFGRYVTSQGEEHFVAQNVYTPNAANSGPKVGPIVVSEIHFHPPDLPGGEDNGVDEFIELQNVTSAMVPLFDPAHPANTWQIAEAVNFNFPPGTSMPAEGRLVLVGFDPGDTTALASFRAKFGAPPSVPVFGPYEGKLDNSSERVELYKPDAPELGVVPYVLVDAVEYRDDAPWPIGADGTGASLRRLNPSQYGDDPINWIAATPTPGSAASGGAAPAIVTQPASQNGIASQSVTFQLAATGATPMKYQWRFNGANLDHATNATLTLDDLQPWQAGQYSAAVYNPAGAAISSNATLQVLYGAYITASPLTVNLRGSTNSANYGFTTNNATFSVTAFGNGQLSYQWRFNGQNITGATGTSLTVSNVDISHEGNYQVAITDALGTVVSDPVRLNVLVTPMILIPPVAQSVITGGTFTVGAVISGNPTPFTYVWRQQSTPRVVDVATARSAFATLNAPATLVTNQSWRLIVRNLASTGDTVTAQFLITTMEDTDNDGIPNRWESDFGMDPNNNLDRNIDGDGDGMFNWQEYVAGTDPTNALSYLKISSISLTGGATVTFGTITNRTYTVEYTDNLGSMAWSRLADIPARTVNRTESVFDPDFTTNRNYRLVTPRQP